MRRRLRVGPEEKLVCCMKTLRKDSFETAVEAVAEIDDPRVRLLLPSRDPSIDLSAIAASRGVADRCIIVPDISPDDTPTFYAAADVVIIPYVKREYGLHENAAAPPGNRSVAEMTSDGFAACTSLGVLEAFSCGLPTVIATPGATVRMDGTDIGALVPAWDPNAMARAVVALASDGNLSGRLGSNARDFVLRSLTWDRIVSRTLDVYRTAAGRR
jgi:glycosyltransferase involved in cell wall biosynthesis